MVVTMVATLFVAGTLNVEVAVAAEAGICTPSAGVIGDGGGLKTDNDDGVATWVGRDMYVGAPNASGQTNYTGDVKPEQSYAVEAEGLTVVNGKLALHGVKGKKNGKENPEGVDNANFNGHGFRFGTVGFGANLRPVKASDVLVVGGNTSAITLRDRENKDVNVLAWGNAARGYVRSDSLGPAHNARIRMTSNNQSKAHDIDWDDNYDGLERNPNNKDEWQVQGDSIFNFDDPWNRYQGDWNTGSFINWDTSDNPLRYVQLNKAWIEGQSTHTDLSGFQEVVHNTSSVLKARPMTGEGKASIAPAQENFYRQNYGNASYKVTFDFGDGNTDTPAERLITFTGNGMKSQEIDSSTGAYKVNGGSVMQVFTLDASLLTNAGTNGVSFRFDNIPEYASVVVNVVGGTDGIDFNNGWRFWWNGAEISNFYTVFNQENQEARNALYSHAASALMWNFADASKVTIRGGRITEGQNGKVQNSHTLSQSDPESQVISVGGNGQTAITDDPVANMLGSIMVPNGSLETHVSTNGRVWVGQDYMMYNPIGLTDLAWTNGFNSSTGWHETISASVVEQDQERHNFGWHGEISDACAVLEWSKVDNSGNALAGTEWAIYKSLDDAKANNTASALITVADDGHDDWAIGTNGQGSGKFQVRRLNPNAKYYLREISAPSGYTTNTNIYEIRTGTGNQTESDIDNVVDGGFVKPSTEITAAYDSNGNSTTNTLLWSENADQYGSRIINIEERYSVRWQKIDSTSGNALSGATWTLQKFNESNKQYETLNDGFCDNGAWGCTPEHNTIDVDEEGGKFKLENLEAGKYRLKEQTAPMGYLTSDKYYYFEAANTTANNGEVTQITIGGTDFTDNGDPKKTHGDALTGDNKQIGNDRKPGEVTWQKIAQKPQAVAKEGASIDTSVDPALSEQENHQLLAGSEWSLAYTPYDDTTGTATTVTIKDCIALTDGSKVNCTVAENGNDGQNYSWAVDADTAAGKFKVTGMPWGSYVLTETKAPDGYNLDSTPHYFTVGVTNLNNNGYVGIIGAADASDTVGVEDNAANVIAINLGEIENEPGVVLPMTGRGGLPLWAVLTGIVLVLGVMLMAVKLRKQTLA